MLITPLSTLIGELTCIIVFRLVVYLNMDLNYQSLQPLHDILFRRSSLSQIT